MNISKSILNYAKRRNIELTVENDGSEVWFYEADNDCEPMFIMFNNADCLTWKGNIYLKQEVKEELPATISSEAKLKEVLNFLSANI